MKKYLLLLLFIATVTVHAQVTFQKTFGGLDLEQCETIQQTSDNGYILGGLTFNSSLNNFDIYIVKTDSTGNTVWTKTFGNNFSEWGNSVTQTIDGGYVFAGISQIADTLYNLYLIKIDANGNNQWTKIMDGIFSEEGMSVQQTNDSGFVITGVVTSFGAGLEDFFLVKTNANGDFLWTKTYGGTSNDLGYSVQQTSDSGYVISGVADRNGPGNTNVCLIKTDVNGDTLWTRKLGGADIEYGYYVQQTTDGGYIITGFTNSFGAGGYDVYLIKTDASGYLLWSKTYGGAASDVGFAVEQTTDGGYIITGISQSFGLGENDIYLIRTDSMGDSLWTKRIGGTGPDNGFSVHQTSDGGFIIGGYTESFGIGNSDAYLIKTDAYGNSGCNEEPTATIISIPSTQVENSGMTVTSPTPIVNNPTIFVGSVGIENTICISDGINVITRDGFDIFPNPANGKLAIRSVQLPIKAIAIMNVLGEQILAAHLPTSNFLFQFEMDISGLTPGIYFVKVQSEKGNAVKKLIVQ